MDLVLFASDSGPTIVKVLSIHASLLIEGRLVFGENSSEFWVAVRGHQVPLLHVPTHIITLVEVWRCSLLLLGGVDRLVVKNASDASRRLPIWTRRFEGGVHWFALGVWALFLLDLGSGMGGWVEVYEVIVSASEIDARNVFGIEVLRVRPQHWI